jgi:hypothetical protein
MDDISIDRLVFEVPGLTEEQAQDLAVRVGQGLAAAKTPSGDFGSLTVDLNDQALSHDLPRLANEIVDLLIRQVR